MATKNIVGHLVYKITGDSTELDTSLKKSQSSTEKFTKFIKSALGIGGAIIAVKALIGIGKDLIKSYGEQEQASNRLAAAIRATGGDVDSLMAQYTSFASEMQAVTTVGDEQTLGLLQQAQSFGITRDKMLEATQGAIGLSKAFGVDMNTALRGIALAYQGNYAQLSRYIPALRTASTEAEKQAILQKTMADGFSLARAEAETSTGQLLQLENAIGDLKEEGGRMLLDFLTPSIRALKDYVTETAKAIAETGRLQKIAKELAEGKKVAAKDEIALIGQRIEALRIERTQTDPLDEAALEAIDRKIAAEEAYTAALLNAARYEAQGREAKAKGDAKAAAEADKRAAAEKKYTDGLAFMNKLIEDNRSEYEQLAEQLAYIESFHWAEDQTYQLEQQAKAAEILKKKMATLGIEVADTWKEIVAAQLDEAKALEDATNDMLRLYQLRKDSFGEMHDEMADIRKRKGKKADDEESKAAEEQKEKIERIRQELFDFVSGLCSFLSALNQATLDRELADLQAALERNKAAVDEKYGVLTQAELDYNQYLKQKEAERYASLSEEEKQEYDLRVAAQEAEQARLQAAADEKAALDLEYEHKKAQMEYDAALTSWRLTLVQSLASAAQAFIVALTTKPIWVGLIMAAIVSGMTAAQIGLIRANKPIAPKFAEGADFIVPPGYPNDSYPMQVESGEHVVVEPRGRVVMQAPLIIEIDSTPVYRGLLKATTDGIALVRQRAVVR